MIVRDNKPGHPPDGTVCADRRPHHRIGPAAAGAAEEAVRCRAGVLGGGASAARGAVGASLAADVLRAAGAPVPLPAQAAWLSQAGQGRRPADLQDHAVPGDVVPVVADDLRLLDATPVPCGASRQTVQRSELAGWANYGYCAAHSRWYWGLKLYLITTPDGIPVTWCPASPKIGEREVAAELLAHAAGVYARITHRLLALAAAIWHNWATSQPIKRSLIAYDN